MNNKLKILVIPSWFPLDGDNNGIYFEEQILCLMNQGYDIDVLYFKLKEISKKELLKNILRFDFNCFFINSVSKQLNKNLKGKAYILYDYTFLPSFLRIKIIECLVLLKSRRIYFNAKKKPNIVHGFSSFGAGMFTKVIADLYNAKSILTEHQVFNLSYYNSAYQKKIISCLMEVDSINCVSQYLARMMYSQYIHRKIDVFHNLIQDAFFKMSNNASKDCFTIAFVGYDEFVKGLDVFLDILQCLKKDKCIDFKVFLIGKYKTLHSKILPFLEKNDLVQQVIIYEQLNKYELAKVLTNTQVLVSTSRAETFGLTVREAMAVGTPVICTRSGGVEEDLEGYWGLCDIDDVEQLTARVYDLYRNLELYKTDEMRERIQSKYGTIAFLNQINLMYQSVFYCSNEVDK